MTQLGERLRRIFVPARSEQPLRAVLRHQVPVLIAFSLLTLVLEHLGWLRGFESYALDSLLLFRAQQPPSNVVLVTIDDEDYRTIFDARSPVDPGKLQQVLEAIAAGKPSVIGVDLETSAPQFAGPAWPAAVWARDGYPLEHAGGGGHGEGAQPVVRLPILGGRFVERLEGKELVTEPLSGMVLFPQDHDGVVRRYQRYFPSPEAEPPAKLEGEADSLPWAVAKQFARQQRAAGQQPCAECDRIEKIERTAGSEELVLNFAGEQYRFNRLNVRNLLSAASKDYWAENSPLRDKIVLLGGTYRAARDEYVTPVGVRSGVELIAQAIASELQGGGIRPINWVVATAMDLVNGLILIYLNWRFPGRLAATVNVALIVVLSIVGSLVAFRAVAYWFNFSAVLVGLWIDILWHQTQEKRHLQAELERYRRGQAPAGH